MAGPSPDWFTGIYNFSPLDPTQQFWYQSFEIATYPWDAGTEQGTTYSINNNPEVPHQPIFRLTRDTVPASGILLDPTRTEVLPVATWSCALDGIGSGRALKKEGAAFQPETTIQSLCGGNRNLSEEEEAPSAGLRGTTRN
ncbi:unnamed protein product [Pseudo-nitzschia multistriata]|uniref:Spondin domain-containing protein n=1 Tax=Pseudo-nitzschia multistriata TaxID=183589 RepID=A0A448YYA2_9STRA|nr:unnamed protein product [Pseudo-nitzschia multistriata]